VLHERLRGPRQAHARPCAALRRRRLRRAPAPQPCFQSLRIRQRCSVARRAVTLPDDESRGGRRSRRKIDHVKQRAGPRRPDGRVPERPLSIPVVVGSRRSDPRRLRRVLLAPRKKRDWEASELQPRSMAEMLPRLSAPALFVFAERDHTISLDNVRRVRDALEAATPQLSHEGVRRHARMASSTTPCPAATRAKEGRTGPGRSCSLSLKRYSAASGSARCGGEFEGAKRGGLRFLQERAPRMSERLDPRKHVPASLRLPRRPCRARMRRRYAPVLANTPRRS